ncbi:MAG: hypothetical protein K2N73_10430 [Lachnospiraceae bacterium]|nr:hypothetical protein [Lachnospiraceae bacterium]
MLNYSIVKNDNIEEYASKIRKMIEEREDENIIGDYLAWLYDNAMIASDDWNKLADLY